MATYDSEFDDSTQCSTSVPAIHPPTPQIYPRTHLFGIPQELQDMIVHEVWNDNIKNAGACSLQPLLTCRHFYHIANKHAWEKTSFDMRPLSQKGLEDIFASIPPKVASRNICSVTATALQVEMIAENADALPNIKLITITDFESEGMHITDRSVEWFTALTVTLELRHKVEGFRATAAAFEGKMPTTILAHTLLLAINDELKGETEGTVAIFCKKKTAQTSERYQVVFRTEQEKIYRDVLRADDSLL